jgi:threonine dehydratase
VKGAAQRGDELLMAGISPGELAEARPRVAAHVHRTPILRSRQLNELTGADVRLKAELFQRTGSYKIRGPLNKLALLGDDDRSRGVICSSAGNHAQGLALAAAIHGVPAVVVMAENATPSKIDATRGYGAEVVLHGEIWDDANQKSLELAAERGMTLVHPFDDVQLIAGQATLGFELVEDCPEVDVVVVPIGGGGLISGVSLAVKTLKPNARVIGVESSGAPGMLSSVRAGHVVALEEVDCVIDGLRVKRVGEVTFEIVRRFVDDIVTLPDEDIFSAVLWLMSRCKLVVEGAAAAPVAALLHGLVDLAPGETVACVLSGGNVGLEPFRRHRWN